MNGLVLCSQVILIGLDKIMKDYVVIFDILQECEIYFKVVVQIVEFLVEYKKIVVVFLVKDNVQGCDFFFGYFNKFYLQIFVDLEKFIKINQEGGDVVIVGVDDIFSQLCVGVLGLLIVVLVIGMGLVIIMGCIIVVFLQDVVGIVCCVVGGDLGVEISVYSKDEIGQLL